MSKNKDSGAQEAILKYLNKQNRPYSAVDVFNNLHKEHGKTVVTRALEQLAQEGKINEKTYGKQKVYFSDQKNYPVVADSELKNMDGEILKLTSVFAELQLSVKSRESLLSNLSGSLTTAEVKLMIATLTKETETLRSKLETLTTNKSAVSSEEKNRIYNEKENRVKEWRKRKRLANDMIDAILESYPKEKKILFEEIGFETDEDAKVLIPK